MLTAYLIGLLIAFCFMWYATECTMLEISSSDTFAIILVWAFYPLWTGWWLVTVMGDSYKDEHRDNQW